MDFMLDFVKWLKVSMVSIYLEFDVDKEVVEKVGEGLDKIERMMELVMGRMGVLKKMMEG